MRSALRYGFALGTFTLLSLVVACSSTNVASSPNPDPGTGDSGTGTDPVGTDSGTTTEGGSNTDSGKDGSVAPATKTGSGTYESNLTDFAITIVDVEAHASSKAIPTGGFQSQIELEMVEFVGRCSDRGAGIRRRNIKRIEIELEKEGPTMADAAITPGTYAFGKNPGGGETGYERRVVDASCNSTGGPDLPASFDNIANVTVNKLVIETISATHVKGSYELRASNNDYVKGTFDVDFCTATPPSTPAVCQDKP